MAGKFHHEQIYRGSELLERLAKLRITICGVGAVGSNLADNLLRQGVAHLRAIDKDRVEEHNVSTQTYAEADVGVWKVEALRNRLFKVAGVEIDAVRKELTAQNARPLLGDCDLVIDAFDNSTARQLLQEAARASGVPCLHVGLYEDYCEAIWDEQYRVPRDVAGDVCDYPLARNLVVLSVVIASESIMKFVASGERAGWSGTLGDLAVRKLEP
ncbi:MAG: thiamine biosynthesis protein ThiF [Phycisphaerales bacterium]|nr:thiamine biosynthesis protein ThiF [Phycisphaerales bacterium]